MTIRLVLADDHPLILDGLEKSLEREKDFQVLARCSDGEEALKAVREHRPDILILDLRMPRKGGMAVLQQMRKEQLAGQVVILTGELGSNEVLEAIRLGVRGILLKEMAHSTVTTCVRTVHAGGQWLERRSVREALDTLIRRETGTRELAAILTPRELEIVRMVAQGMRNRVIADKLCIEVGTVKMHLHHIYGKLNIDNRLDLLRHAQERGLI